MVTRTKAPPAEPEPEAPEAPADDGSRSATVADVERIVSEAIRSVLAPEAPAAEPEPEAEPVEKLTYRGIEERMEKIVGAKVGELKAAEPPEAQASDSKPEAEPEVPPPVKKRRVESLWK